MFVEVLFLLIVTVISATATKATGSVYPYLLFLGSLVLVLPGLMANIWAPFVPSFKKRIGIMIDIADIKPKNITYDLGAGDGRLIKAASRKGAKSYGIELSFPLVLYFWIRNGFRSKNGRMVWGNFWKKDYSDADVIFCYLYPRTMKVFLKKIYPKLKKGTKIVSNTFSIPTLKAEKEIDQIYLYIKK